MFLLISLLLISNEAAPSEKPSDLSSHLAELFRLSDEYRQCLILDKSVALDDRDTFFAEGGMSSENLDLLVSDRQDQLLKHLIGKGRGAEIIEALRSVYYIQVNEDKCRDFDPYFSPVLEKLVDLEKLAGIEAAQQRRSRPQRRR